MDEFELIRNYFQKISSNNPGAKKLNEDVFFDKKNIIEIRRMEYYIEINIFDNGIGFSTGNKKEIIKPYYTTKKKGSGLGLSIVNKIINDHNGSIEFNSKSSGTNVNISLPIK